MEPQNKGKPIATSVPSISIKFHANAEQLEEIYVADDEQSDSNIPGTSSASSPSSSSNNAPGANDSEGSPLKLLPRLAKRSTSIDITPGVDSVSSSSPPSSDPWRFFSDIRGKITKSVEEKISEIKTRNNQDETHSSSSPAKHKNATAAKETTSDSEDLSESSLSKTCGGISTTEGAEMSTDDEDETRSSMDFSDPKKDKLPSQKSLANLRQRFRFLKAKAVSSQPQAREEQFFIPRSSLVRMYNIQTDKIEQALPEETEIESGVEAFERDEEEGGENEDAGERETECDRKLLTGFDGYYDNVNIDDERVVHVVDVPGSSMRSADWEERNKRVRSVYSPSGFVDMRAPSQLDDRITYLPLVMFGVFLILYLLVNIYSTYCAGVIAGITATYTYYYVKSLLHTPVNPAIAMRPSQPQVLELVPPVKEHQPMKKYEGWMNEYPETYNPHTYHITQTQSVFLRLQGNLLRLSHTRSKVLKRALWNEPPLKPVFTHHRIYNLLGADVALLPLGLTKKRHWSKKYPICVTLSKSQLRFEEDVAPPSPQVSLASTVKVDEDGRDYEVKRKKGKKSFFKRKKYPVLSQQFSKLTEEDLELDSDNELTKDNEANSSPEPPSFDLSDTEEKEINNILPLYDLAGEDDQLTFWGDEDNDKFEDCTDENLGLTRLYLFGRTDREKEDWFRRFAAATHQGAQLSLQNNEQEDFPDVQVSETLIKAAAEESDYVKFMMNFNKACKNADDTSPQEILWINTLIGRILFDCFNDASFTKKVKDRIQRKLASIKLPYFIEELTIEDLSLGRTPPLIHRAGKPTMDERGLWVDLDISYEGLVALILKTKLNLMKLKHAQRHHDLPMGRSAIFHSDVDDSAESTSDDDGAQFLYGNQPQSAPALDASGYPVAGLGGTSNTSKKFIRMVDKIAESKFFQAATENRYIKKAMEGVSNTELRLKLEVKGLVGTLVLNIPPPPSDRVWIGFRPTPEVSVTAQPIVGERNITFLRITSWIESKLLNEFQKILVIPNMEDFTIPVMNPKLPK